MTSELQPVQCSRAVLQLYGCARRAWTTDHNVHKVGYMTGTNESTRSYEHTSTTSRTSPFPASPHPLNSSPPFTSPGFIFPPRSPKSPMTELCEPPRRRNVFSRVLLTLHLLRRKPLPDAAQPVCVCGYPPHGIDPHIKPFLPRSPPEPEFEDWPEDTPDGTRYPVPTYSPRVVPARYRRVLHEIVGPTSAPWTEAAESWVACEREHERECVAGQTVGVRWRRTRGRLTSDFLIKVCLGRHKRVYCLPWQGERTTFGHIKAKFAHDIYKHLGLGPLFLE